MVLVSRNHSKLFFFQKKIAIYFFLNTIIFDSHSSCIHSKCFFLKNILLHILENILQTRVFLILILLSRPRKNAKNASRIKYFTQKYVFPLYLYFI